MKSIDDLLVNVRECLPKKNVTIVVQDEQQRKLVCTRLATEFKTFVIDLLDKQFNVGYHVISLIAKTNDPVLVAFSKWDYTIEYVVSVITNRARTNVVFIVDNVDDYFGYAHAIDTHIITWSSEISDVIATPIQHRCPLCKDTGTRHFEFYDRTCECQL